MKFSKFTKRFNVWGACSIIFLVCSPAVVAAQKSKLSDELRKLSKDSKTHDVIVQFETTPNDTAIADVVKGGFASADDHVAQCGVSRSNDLFLFEPTVRGMAQSRPAG